MTAQAYTSQLNLPVGPTHVSPVGAKAWLTPVDQGTEKRNIKQ